MGQMSEAKTRFITEYRKCCHSPLVNGNTPCRTVIDLKVVTNVIESQVNISTDQDAGVADEVGAVTEVSQVGLHHSFDLVLPQVVERLHERCGRQKQSAATCITAELAATAQINDIIRDSIWKCLQCFDAV